MAGSVLTVENLRVTFSTLPAPVQAVRGVSFHLDAGECLGIVGESGSGKSVTAWAAAGLLGKDARVEGTLVRNPRTSMIFQEPSRSFDPIMNLENTFLETFRVHDPKTTKAQSRDRAAALLAEVHIAGARERLGSFPHQFSGGMLQRVLIALALAGDPEVLLCDEPTTALDVTIQAQILALLKELQTRRRLALIFISHDLETVAQVADRLLVMYGGLVMEEGRTEDVLKAPTHPYTRALWQSRVRRGSHYKTQPLVLIGGQPPDPRFPEPGCPFAPRCVLAQPECSVGIPPLERVGDRTHRCFFPLGAP